MMARMWMERGKGGSLYDAFGEHGMAAIGWDHLAAYAEPSVGRKQLIDLYRAAKPQAKHGTLVSGAFQVWRFVNDLQEGDGILTYSPANRLYSIGKAVGPAEHHPEWTEQRLSLARKIRWQ
jgi:restriction system protein